MVRPTGIEPACLAAPEPKSGASTNFATGARKLTHTLAKVRVKARISGSEQSFGFNKSCSIQGKSPFLSRVDVVETGRRTMNQEFFSILIQVVAAFGFTGFILVASVLAGKRAQHRTPADVPYECGMIPIGSGAPMVSVKYYIVAMLFLVFDIEVVFLYPWSINFRDLVIHNADAFVSMTVFLGVLAIAYAYALGKGVLVWHRDPKN